MKKNWKRIRQDLSGDDEDDDAEEEALLRETEKRRARQIIVVDDDEDDEPEKTLEKKKRRQLQRLRKMAAEEEEEAKLRFVSNKIPIEEYEPSSSSSSSSTSEKKRARRRQIVEEEEEVMPVAAAAAAAAPTKLHLAIRLKRKDPDTEVCNKWSLPLTDAQIGKRHRAVREYILAKFPEAAKQVVWSERFVKNAVHAIDKYYFDSQLYDRLKIRKIDIFFIQSHTKHWGYCQRKGCGFVIALSERLSTGIFQKGEKSYSVNGIHVTNGLDYLLSVLEHELVHLIVDVYCPEGRSTGKRQTRIVHGPVFRAIVQGSFAHTKITGSGEDEEVRATRKEQQKSMIRKTKATIRPGSLIVRDAEPTHPLVVYDVKKVNMFFTDLVTGKSFKSRMSTEVTSFSAEALTPEQRVQLALVYIRIPALPRVLMT